MGHAITNACHDLSLIDHTVSMIIGPRLPNMRPWPEDVHQWHAERRWLDAKGRWLDAHPAAADQWVRGFLAEIQEG